MKALGIHGPAMKSASICAFLDVCIVSRLHIAYNVSRVLNECPGGTKYKTEFIRQEFIQRLCLTGQKDSNSLRFNCVEKKRDRAPKL